MIALDRLICSVDTITTTYYFKIVHKGDMMKEGRKEESPYGLASSAVDHLEASSPCYWTSQSVDVGETPAKPESPMLVYVKTRRHGEGKDRSRAQHVRLSVIHAFRKNKGIEISKQQGS